MSTHVFHAIHWFEFRTYGLLQCPRQIHSGVTTSAVAAYDMTCMYRVIECGTQDPHGKPCGLQPTRLVEAGNRHNHMIR